jgi:arylsulfatase A-like enzyme
MEMCPRYHVILIALLSLTGCRHANESKVVRLIEVFDSAKIEGAPAGKPLAPGALWEFGSPPQGSKDPLLGWKPGDGVAGLKVSEGKLTGRSTTDFPIVYVSRPKTVDPNDAFDSVEVRMRVSAGANVSASGGNAKPDFAQVIGRGRGFPWPFHIGLSKSANTEGLQTLTLPAQLVTRMNWETLMLRPTDVAGATFEIESIRAISQRERRASIRSGVGWQGLADIYQEALVSRSPEKFTLTLDIPKNAWLDLNVGTLEDHPVTFKIAEVAAGREDLLLERTLTTAHRWEPAPVDLSAHTGKRALRFWLEVPEERSIGFWGSPVIRVRGGQPVTTRPAGGALGRMQAPQGVVLIMCDTLRRDHLPMYGYQRDTSPNLTRLAGRGATFLDNVTQATWTKVATPSIMTSLYPASHQVYDFTDRVSAAADTLAESYHNAGYATVSYSSVPFTGKLTNLQQGFEELHESTSVNDPKYHAKTARIYVDRAMDWIERHRDVPFFLYLHVLDPHDPFEPRPPYDTLWANPAQKEEHEHQLEKIRKFIQDPLLKAFGMPTRQEIEKAGVNAAEYVAFDKDWYDGSIRGMDAEVGRLVERLRSLGLENKVQIAFIGDHGEEFIEHGRMFHGQSAYGELAGVPLLLYRPGVIPEGVEIKETVRSIDLMPTLLDLSGLPVPKRAQGQSLVPLLAAARDAKAKGSNGSIVEAAQAMGWKPQPAVTEKSALGGPPSYLGTESYGIVSGGWKLIHNPQRHDPTPEFELYSHGDDPLDKMNVAARHPEVVERLRAQLTDWHKMVERGKLPKGDAPEGISPADLKRLRSLGYVQ